jgi:hypothetical protein
MIKFDAYVKSAILIAMQISARPVNVNQTGTLTTHFRIMTLWTLSRCLKILEFDTDATYTILTPMPI